MKHNKEARHWFDLSHVWFKKAVSLSWQKNACSAAFYLDWFQRKGLIIWDQSVHPYVNDMSQSVKELQLWNPVECLVPYPIRRCHNMFCTWLTSCFHVMQFLMLLTYVIWWKLSFQGTSAAGQKSECLQPFKEESSHNCRKREGSI